MSDFPLLVGRTLEGDLPPAVTSRLDDRYQPSAGGRTIHVSPTGLASGDGLTSGSPVSIDRAISILAESARPVLPGDWTIQLTAGTHKWRNVEIPEGLLGEGTLTIAGPSVGGHPNVPTAKISDGYNVVAAGVNFREGSMRVVFRDLHFEGYNGSSASAGINIGSSNRSTYLVNVHFTDCHWGISASKGSRYDVKGGIARRCGFLGDTPNTAPANTRNGAGGAYRSLMGVSHSIGTQNAGNTNLGPWIYNSRHGLHAQETSTGHVDWCRIEDCDFGVRGLVNSRANVDGTSFKRNQADLHFSGGSHVFVSGNVAFGSGADASLQSLVLTTGAQLTESSRVFADASVSYTQEPKIFVQDYPSLVITGTTVIKAVTLRSALWRHQPSALGGTRSIRFVVAGQMAGAGLKRVNIRFGGSVICGLIMTAGETGDFMAEGLLALTSSASQRAWIKGQTHLGSVRNDEGSSAVDMSADRVFQVEGQVDSPATITVTRVEMSWT